MLIIGCDFHTRYQQIAMVGALRFRRTRLLTFISHFTPTD